MATNMLDKLLKARDACADAPVLNVGGQHQSRSRSATGQMTVGPRGGFETVPGRPLACAEIVERDGNVDVRS
jgi:hypothetical protein